MSSRLKFRHGRKFPPRVSRDELSERTQQVLSECGVDNHSQAQFTREIAKEVIGLKEYKYESLQPELKLRNDKFWRTAFSVTQSFLKDFQMDLTIDAMKIELQDNRLPLDDRFKQDSVSFIENLLETNEKLPFSERVKRFAKRENIAAPQRSSSVQPQKKKVMDIISSGKAKPDNKISEKNNQNKAFGNDDVDFDIHDSSKADNNNSNEQSFNSDDDVEIDMEIPNSVPSSPEKNTNPKNIPVNENSDENISIDISDEEKSPQKNETDKQNNSSNLTNLSNDDDISIDDDFNLEDDNEEKPQSKQEVSQDAVDIDEDFDENDFNIDEQPSVSKHEEQNQQNNQSKNDTNGKTEINQTSPISKDNTNIQKVQSENNPDDFDDFDDIDMDEDDFDFDKKEEKKNTSNENIEDVEVKFDSSNTPSQSPVKVPEDATVNDTNLMSGNSSLDNRFSDEEEVIDIDDNFDSNDSNNKTDENDKDADIVEDFDDDNDVNIDSETLSDEPKDENKSGDSIEDINISFDD